MQVARYFKMFGFCVLYLFLFYWIQVLVSFALGVLLSSNSGLEIKNILLQMGIFNLNSDVTQLIETNKPFILLLAYLLTLLALSAVLSKRGMNLVKTCKFSNINSKSVLVSIVLGTAIGIFAFYLIYVVSILKDSTKFTKQINQLINENPDIFSPVQFGSESIILIILICLISPIVEEILFRGLIFNEIKNATNTTLAVIIQAIAYMCFQMNGIQAIYAFALSIVVICSYIWTESLWAPIIIHVFANTTSILFNRIPYNQGLSLDFITIITIVNISIFLFVIFIIITGLYFLWKNKILNS